MAEEHFEGSLVLERLAEVDKLEEFYHAIDSDDFKRAEELMRAAQIDQETISIVLDKMKNSDEEH